MSSILVIDDFASVRIYHQILLRNAGFTPLLAKGGQEALETLESGDIDLVLLDLVMPGMPGIEFLEHMRSLPARRQTPVIVVSSEAEGREAVRARDEFGCCVLQKPVPPQELMGAVRLLLERGDA